MKFTDKKANTATKAYKRTYILTEEQYRHLIAMVYTNLEYSHYEKYNIRSIYFDAPHQGVMQKIYENAKKGKYSLHECFLSEKFGDMFFFESETKEKYTIRKNVLAMPYGLVRQFLSEKKAENEAVNLPERITYMIETHQLYPIFYLSCDRLVMHSTGSPGLRLIFDRNLIRQNCQCSKSPPAMPDFQVFPKRYIMGIKTAGPVPAWLSAALHRLDILPC